MKHQLSFIILFIFSLFSLESLAQNTQNNLISIDLKKASFEQFVKEIEGQTSYHFYYEPSELQHIKTTVSVKNASLIPLLESVLEGSNLYFSIDKKKDVFITKGTPVSVEMYSGNFTDNLAIAESKIPKEGSGDKELNVKRKVVDEISIQNKLFDIGLKTNASPEGNVNVAGYIRDLETGEPISGALIYIDKSQAQATSDQFGYYSITLPAGRRSMNVVSAGKFDARRQLMLYSSGKFNIDMEQKIQMLKEVKIDAGKVSNLRNVDMGANKLDISALKHVPAAMGEVDVLRAVQAMPGVKTVGEASAGFNVRGGATDQNLILYSGNNIFNPTHLFGFFSAFNPEVVKNVTLYKSSIPANYGGRISSVLDINTLNGNENKIAGSVGIGPLTGKAVIEGPLFNKKTTFIAGFRTTYSDWIFKLLPKEYEKSKASFQDADLHLTHQIDSANTLYFNGYMSGDEFNLGSDTAYSYQNKNMNVKWKHTFNNRIYAVLTAGVDYYNYKIKGDKVPENAYELSYAINQYKLNADFNYFLNNKHKLAFGINTLHYKINPGSYLPMGKDSYVDPDIIETEQAIESALYVSDQYKLSSKISIDAGVRVSMFNYLGPKNITTYIPGIPRESTSIQENKFYTSGKIIKTYVNPEIRLSGRYSIDDESSVKASFNTLSQYIHMLSNTTTVSPSDIWKLSDNNIEPTKGMQVSLGYYRNLSSNTIEVSVELYYKWIKNYLDYKSNAQLTMNHHVEADIFKTKGKSYGVELLVTKATGKLNGWIGYTYSRALIKQDDPIAGELINKGNYYPNNFDQPHNATFTGNYRFNHRISASLNATYSTGRPVTVPVGIYDYRGGLRLLYSDRNEYRIPDYFRTDLSFNFEGNHKLKQIFHNTWTVGVYNLTGRQNAYSVYFLSDKGFIKGYQLSIFGSMIPFITYNIRF